MDRPPIQRRTAADEVAVDVIINNYQYARYLPRAIDSALAQTHPSTNVIVVDDGSTDGSRDIIASYGDRIEAVLKPNGGQASAVNAGMTRSAGDAVIFLDADDELEPEAASRVAAAFAARPDLARVHFRLGVMDGDGAMTDELKPPARLALADGDLREATLSCPFDAAWLPTSGNAFRAEPLRRVLPVPEGEYRLCADWYLVHVSSLLGPVGAIDQPLGRYRVHAANGFTRSDGLLDLAHVADTARFAAITRRHLVDVAHREGLTADLPSMASMCDVANRAILARLSTDGSGADSRRRLLGLGIRACRARRDVGITMKAMFISWLALTLVAPRRLARRLGTLFLLPESRPALDDLLGSLHRR